MKRAGGGDRLQQGLVAVTLAITAVSTLVGLAGHSGQGWVDPFRVWLDADWNGIVPVGFETGCLLIAAAACAWRARDMSHAAGGTWVSHWYGLAVLVALMGVEKAVGLHEIAAGRVAQDYGTFRGGLFGVFIGPALVIVGFLAWAYREFLKALPKETRRGLLIGWGLLLAGGIGVETVQAIWIRMTGGNDVVVVVLANLEEGVEMLGAAMIAWVLWRLVRRQVALYA